MNFSVCKVYSCACIFFFSYRLDVHVFYDQSFFERFGEKSVTRIRHLLSIVKVIFSEPTLTTVIVPNVINISYYRERSWEASGKDLQYVELTTFLLLFYFALKYVLQIIKLSFFKDLYQSLLKMLSRTLMHTFFFVLKMIKVVLLE